MKKANTYYYIGFTEDKNDIKSPPCKSIKEAIQLIEHYQINELNEDFTCNTYTVRTAQKKNVITIY